MLSHTKDTTKYEHPELYGLSIHARLLLPHTAAEARSVR